MTSLPSVPPQVMPTADSIADAEQLIREVAIRGGDALNARWHGWCATEWMATRGIYNDEWLDGVILTCVKDAARHAFVAVPELRIPDFQSAEDR